jgi:hypothetical protein
MMMIFGAIGGMKIGRGNRSTRRKPTPNESVNTSLTIEAVHGYLVPGLYPSSSVQKNKNDKNTTFRRLDLPPSSGGWGRVDLFSWGR